MSTLGEVLKNIGILTLSKILRPFFSVFLTIVIARVFKAQGLGEYRALFTYLMVFEILAGFGLNTLLTREVAKNRAGGLAYYAHGLMILLPVSVICIILLNGWIFLLDKPAHFIQATLILSVSLLSTAWMYCAEGTLIGYEKMRVIAYLLTAETVVRVILSIIVVMCGGGLILLAIIYTVVRFAMATGYHQYITRYIGRLSWKIDKALLWELIHLAKTFALIMVFVTLYWKLDIIMLDMMKGDTAVGLYEGGYRFFDIIHVMIGTYVVAIFPMLSHYHKADYLGFIIIARKAIKYFVILAIPGVVLLIFLSGTLVQLVMGNEYSSSIPVLILLSLAIIPYGITEVFAHTLVASSNQKIDMMINGIGMLLNFLLNLILIPRYSYTGAAVATVISIYIYLGIQIPFLLNRVKGFRSQENRTSLLRLTLAVSSFAALAVLGYVFHFKWILSIAIPFYLYIIWKIDVIQTDDKLVIQGILRKLKVPLRK